LSTNAASRPATAVHVTDRRDVPVDDRPEPAHVRAPVAHALDQPLVHLPAADGVDQDADATAASRRAEQRVGEPLRDVATPVHERHHVDGRGRAFDGAEHRREDGIAVAQHPHVVARRRRDPEQ
jgi:hypothetical protein